MNHRDTYDNDEDSWKRLRTFSSRRKAYPSLREVIEPPNTESIWDEAELRHASRKPPPTPPQILRPQPLPAITTPTTTAVVVSPPPATTRDASNELEVAPGFFLPVFGSQETMCAMEGNFMKSGDCFCCSHKVYCVQYASHLLCPACRVVSPIEGGDGPPGVGLGLLEKEFMHWQFESQGQRLYIG